MNNIHACQTKKRQRTVDVDDLVELFSCCDFFYTPSRRLQFKRIVDPFSIDLFIVNIIFVRLQANSCYPRDQMRKR